MIIKIPCIVPLKNLAAAVYLVGTDDRYDTSDAEENEQEIVQALEQVAPKLDSVWYIDETPYTILKVEWQVAGYWLVELE